MRLVQATHPTIKFDPLGAPEITTDESGRRTVLSQVTGIGAGGKKKVLIVRLMYGKRRPADRLVVGNQNRVALKGGGSAPSFFGLPRPGRPRRWIMDSGFPPLNEG